MAPNTSFSREDFFSGFGAVGKPFDRASDALGRPCHGGIFREAIRARAKPATQVLDDHADGILGNAERGRSVCARAMHSLHRRVYREVFTRSVVFTDRAANLQRMRDDAVVDHADPRDMCGLAECFVDRGSIAHAIVGGDVALLGGKRGRPNPGRVAAPGVF